MPELPEVETIVRKFRPRVEGRTIRAFRSLWRRQVQPSLAMFRRRVTGKRVERLWRRGKFIVADLAPGGHFLIHLRMSGRLEWPAAGEAEPRRLRAVWDFEDGARLWFVDARKFGRIVYTENLAPLTNALGPEPLDASFTCARLAALLAARRRRLKPLLLDQATLAGLGNIYVDEALFRARLHPLRRSDQLAPDEVGALRRAIRSTLREAIRRNGTSLDWIYPSGRMQDYLRVYGRDGAPCVECGGPIEALRVGQRGTHICPRCQPLRRADGAP